MSEIKAAEMFSGFFDGALAKVNASAIALYTAAALYFEHLSLDDWAKIGAMAGGVFLFVLQATLTVVKIKKERAELRHLEKEFREDG